MLLFILAHWKDLYELAKAILEAINSNYPKEARRVATKDLLCKFKDQCELP